MNFQSLRFRLLMAFLSLAIVPLLVGGGILAWQSYELRVAEIHNRQRDLAARMALELESFFRGIEDKLAGLDLVRDFTELEAEAQRRRLAVVLAERRDFRELAVLDELGRERAKVSASEPVAAAELRSRAKREEFTWPLTHRRPYSGPIRFDGETGEPLMVLAVPFLDGRDGPVKAVLVAELRVRRIWDLMQEGGMVTGQAVSVIDAGGRVIAHRNPSVVLRETRLVAMPADGRGIGVDGESVYVVTRAFSIGQQPFTLVAEYAVAEALAPAKRAIAVIAGLVVLALSTVLTLAWYAVRRIVMPVEAVSAAAKAVRDGDLSRRVEVLRDDEIGELAASFNAMTGELQTAIGRQQQAIEERLAAEAAVLRANQDLERRVAERTAELEASNHELEAFSYSVSHDLRAPLRAIDGFSNIVLEDYGDRLDDEGRRLLGVVRQNTVRMGQLINDILSFSRSGRQEMAATAVDMEKLAREVADELLATAPGRNIRLDVGPLPQAWGDRALLRQVLVNLLANAIKFTANRPEAVIEVGGTPGGEKNSYFVKDNGAGFDMQYAEKLFGVFQRLHTQDEFEGTGIGLAIVKRIVVRHGGRVWAEGRVGEGATMHFTLPRSVE